LVLAGLQLTSLSPGVFANVTVQSLDLSHNLLSSISPGAFANVTVQSLDLSNNLLSSIGNGVFAGLVPPAITCCVWVS
jgi:Leucine-rich repeat (LRR) protein